MKSAVEQLIIDLDLIKFLPRDEWVKKRKEVIDKAKELERDNINKAIQDGYEACMFSSH